LGVSIFFCVRGISVTCTHDFALVREQCHSSHEGHVRGIHMARVNESCHTYTHVYTYTYLCIYTLIYVYIYIHICEWGVSAMGWLRVVGSLKIQFSFAEYRLFYRALLQKRPIILRSLLGEATPQYVRVISHTFWDMFTHMSESRRKYAKCVWALTPHPSWRSPSTYCVAFLEEEKKIVARRIRYMIRHGFK